MVVMIDSLLRCCDNMVNVLQKHGMVHSAMMKTFDALSEPPITSSVASASPADNAITKEALRVLFCRPVDPCPLNLSSKLELQSARAQDLYRQKIIIDGTDQALELCLGTVGQASNPTWLLERKYRITASRAHKIWRARKPVTTLKYFFEAPIFHANLAYGVALESEARQKYQQMTGFQVQEVGLIVQPDFPFLGASPDGIVLDNGDVIVLEIKCPKSCEDSVIRTSYVGADGTLNRNHLYFTQVQLQLFCTNAKVCHFFVYSRSDCKLIVIERDNDFI